MSGSTNCTIRSIVWGMALLCAWATTSPGALRDSVRQQPSRPAPNTAPRYGASVAKSYQPFATALQEFAGTYSAPQAKDADPGCDPVPNGCGPDGFPEILIILLNCPLNLVCLEPACNQHDLCYSNCGEFKIGCDLVFLAEMNGICRSELPLGTPETVLCRSFAFIYFAAVALLGSTAYSNAQDIACACEAAPAQRKRVRVRGLVVAPPYADGDFDLLPDDWEYASGLDVEAMDAFEDPDGDGAVNLAEYIRQTHPWIYD